MQVGHHRLKTLTFFRKLLRVILETVHRCLVFVWLWLFVGSTNEKIGLISSPDRLTQSIHIYQMSLCDSTGCKSVLPFEIHQPFSLLLRLFTFAQMTHVHVIPRAESSSYLPLKKMGEP